MGAQQSKSGKTSDPAQKVTLEDFEKLALIGQGSFGKVYQVKKKDTGAIYAMKELTKEVLLQRGQVEHTKIEKAILQHIDHPFIVSLHYAFQTDDRLYMILDFVNGGELFYHLKQTHTFPEDRARFHTAEIVLALEKLHQLSIVYRDLKPENILIDFEGHIKVTDFGLSKPFQDDSDKTHTFCGTPEYIAPEVLLGVGYDMSVDWWSLGTMLYEMLTGLPPYYSRDVKTMYRNILHAKLTFPPGVSEEAQDLLRGMLARDPKQRLGFGPNGAADIKAHPFFASLDWDRVLAKEIEPPFVPPVSDSQHDLTQIDPTFTKMKVENEDPNSNTNISSSMQNQFQGFTYAEAGQSLDAAGGDEDDEL